MPGHVKRGGTGEPDPDPSPYLFVSYDDKQKDLAKVCIICTNLPYSRRYVPRHQISIVFEAKNIPVRRNINCDFSYMST